MKALLSALLLGLSIMSSAFAYEDSFTYLTKPTADNPLISRCAFKVRDDQQRYITVMGEDGYEFLINTAHEDLFKDGSYFYMFIYRRRNTQCTGDIIYEYNAERNIVRILEACRTHGITELDHKNIPYLNQAVRLGNQISDKVPINVAKE